MIPAANVHIQSQFPSTVTGRLRRRFCSNGCTLWAKNVSSRSMGHGRETVSKRQKSRRFASSPHHVLTPRCIERLTPPLRLLPHRNDSAMPRIAPANAPHMHMRTDRARGAHVPKPPSTGSVPHATRSASKIRNRAGRYASASAIRMASAASDSSRTAPPTHVRHATAFCLSFPYSSSSHSPASCGSSPVRTMTRTRVRIRLPRRARRSRLQMRP